MNVYDLILQRRSIRLFQAKSVSRNILQKCVNAARLAPSAANKQPLEFIIVDDNKVKEQVFSCLKWAAYIAPKGDPKPGNEPQAYVVVLINRKIRDKGFEWDAGAAIENMILTALEEDVGSCWVISVDRERIRVILEIPKKYRIDSVLALGYTAEKPVLEQMKDSVEYWKDKEGRLHVPKRKLEDIKHLNGF